MEQDILKHRMSDLSREAENGYYTYSHFLTLAEQGDLDALRREGAVGSYQLEGGFEGAERRLAVFGDPEAMGYPAGREGVFLKIAPVDMKFADSLTHRDLLGSLMALGIKRECLGDIMVHENIGYLYALSRIAPYLTEALTKVKRTPVSVTVIDMPPTAAVARPEITSLTVASERLDSLVAAVYRLSRSEALSLCEKGLVAIDGRVTEKASSTVGEGRTVSVRGYGRFRYEGVLGDTRKGKIRVSLRIF